MTSTNIVDGRRVRPTGTARFLVKGMIVAALLFIMSATAAYCDLFT